MAEKIRPLNAGDMMDLADVIAQCWDHIDHSKLAQASQSNSVEASNELGQEVIGALIKHGREPLFMLLASLHDETLAEFKQRPPAAITDAIEAIMQSEEGRDFFRKLPELLNTVAPS